MFDDVLLKREVRTMLEAEPAPPVDVAAIRSRAVNAAPHALRPRYGRSAGAAAAACAAALLFTPQASSAFGHVLSAVVTWVAPPKPIIAALKRESKNVPTVAQAQAMVPFKLVQPRGLPPDARLTAIWAGPAGSFTVRTNKWTVGPAYATFDYARKDGRTFKIQAERYDPAQIQYAYIWDADKPLGHGTFARYDRFAWRNGEQTTSIIADGGISDAEILRIRGAMGGIALPEIRTKGPGRGQRTRFYIVRKVYKT